jgi:aminoglycoside phosphotransferase (APT) family kinase protein
LALGHYGELQRTLARDVDELLAIGVADMRPQAMAGRFDEALAAGRRFVDRAGDERDRAVLARVEAARERFAEQCSELASRPGGASLDHNDLHPWNILGDPGAGSTRFYDWGDSVVAHPFAALLVPLGFAARVSPQAVARARDAYLEAFADLGTHAELVATLELACRVAKVARALTWERALLAGDEAESDPEFARAPLATLESYLGESYLGGA